MKAHKSCGFCLIVLLNACNGQNKDNTNKQLENKNMVEKFDGDLYKKTNYGFDQFTKNDGSIVLMMDFDSLSGGISKEIPPKPSFITIYKEFYSNGSIKKKETFIGERTKINISEYYDENGNVEKVNEDKKFGKIKTEDVLKFLENKNIINLSSGVGRLDKDGRPSFEIEFDEGKKVYLITIIEGKPNAGPFDGIGEPLASLPLIYRMDGETGKVEEIK